MKQNRMPVCKYIINLNILTVYSKEQEKHHLVSQISEVLGNESVKALPSFHKH